jgi:hypothetical protein
MSVVNVLDSSILASLGGLLEPLQRQPIAAQVVAAVGLGELGQEPVDDGVVEVLAAEEGVAGGRAHPEHAVGQLEDRDVEGAAAEVVDRDALGVGQIAAVGQGGRGRLVDDAQHGQAGDARRVLGRLALGVVEVRRHRDDDVGDRLA